jgi:DNA-binding Xre family transcriptional regulator
MAGKKIRFRLRELREAYTDPDNDKFWETGISQRALAEALAEKGVGLSYAAISQMETGKRNSIRFDTLAAICGFFSVEVEDVLQLDDGRRKRKPKKETRGGGPGPKVRWTPQALDNARVHLAELTATNAKLRVEDRESNRVLRDKAAKLANIPIGGAHLLRLLNQHPEHRR